MKFLYVFLFLAMCLLFAPSANAHHGGFNSRGFGRANSFGVRGGFVGGGPVFFQQTTRGPFGRVRSQTTFAR